MKNKDSLLAPTQEEDQAPFSIPMDSAAHARLLFTSDAAAVTLRADPSITNLANGSFQHATPCLQAQQGCLTIQYEHLPLKPPPLVHLNLNAALPWEMEFRGSVMTLNIDLCNLQLRSLDVLGNIGRLTLSLSTSTAASFLYVAGNVERIEIKRLSTVPLRIQVLGDEVCLESGESRGTIGRYDICISGHAPNITIRH